MRRFIIVHCDHEGANAKVLTIGWCIRRNQIYIIAFIGRNELSGYARLANQTSVRFVMEIQREFGGILPEKALSDWIWQRLYNGLVIPGFGTRSCAMSIRDIRRCSISVNRFARMTHCSASPRCWAKWCRRCSKNRAKAASPYPNIDGISGTLLYHFGMTELEFYTVMFSVAQSIGISAQLILMRALHTPIFRPKSVTLSRLSCNSSLPQHHRNVDSRLDEFVIFVATFGKQLKIAKADIRMSVTNGLNNGTADRFWVCCLHRKRR
ncbi:MAG: citrate/2-methylcitrate synthase [Calditrichia bacterium]